MAEGSQVTTTPTLDNDQTLLNRAVHQDTVAINPVDAAQSSINVNAAALTEASAPSLAPAETPATPESKPMAEASNNITDSQLLHNGEPPRSPDSGNLVSRNQAPQINYNQDTREQTNPLRDLITALPKKQQNNFMMILNNPDSSNQDFNQALNMVLGQLETVPRQSEANFKLNALLGRIEERALETKLKQQKQQRANRPNSPLPTQPTTETTSTQPEPTTSQPDASPSPTAEATQAVQPVKPTDQEPTDVKQQRINYLTSEVNQIDQQLKSETDSMIRVELEAAKQRKLESLKSLGVNQLDQTNPASPAPELTPPTPADETQEVTKASQPAVESKPATSAQTLSPDTIIPLGDQAKTEMTIAQALAERSQLQAALQQRGFIDAEAIPIDSVKGHGTAELRLQLLNKALADYDQQHPNEGQGGGGGSAISQTESDSNATVTIDPQAKTNPDQAPRPLDRPNDRRLSAYDASLDPQIALADMEEVPDFKPDFKNFVDLSEMQEGPEKEAQIKGIISTAVDGLDPQQVPTTKEELTNLLLDEQVNSQNQDQVLNRLKTLANQIQAQIDSIQDLNQRQTTQTLANLLSKRIDAIKPAAQSDSASIQEPVPAANLADTQPNLDQTAASLPLDESDLEETAPATPYDGQDSEPLSINPTQLSDVDTYDPNSEDTEPLPGANYDPEADQLIELVEPVAEVNLESELPTQPPTTEPQPESPPPAAETQPEAEITQRPLLDRSTLKAYTQIFDTLPNNDRLVLSRAMNRIEPDLNSVRQSIDILSRQVPQITGDNDADQLQQVTELMTFFSNELAYLEEQPQEPGPTDLQELPSVSIENLAQELEKATNNYEQSLQALETAQTMANEVVDNLRTTNPNPEGAQDLQAAIDLINQAKAAVQTTNAQLGLILRSISQLKSPNT